MSRRPDAQLTYAALLGRLLKFYREERGLGQEHVAAALGIFQPAYSRIEKGDTSITVAQLRVVAHVFGMRPAQILDDAERWAQNLRRQGVPVSDEKAVPKAALIVGLAFLAAALLAASNS